MNRKSPEQMAKDRAKKVLRTAIRLKHSLEADEEINNVIPDVVKEMDDAASNGVKKELDVGSVFEESK